MSLRIFLVLGLMITLCPAAAAQGRREALVDDVKRSIDRGVKYLKGTQNGDGSWPVFFALAAERKGGGTCLALLALLNAGVPASDPYVQNGLKNLRGLKQRDTYVVALQTMVLAHAGHVEDAELIQQNVKWLLDARVYDRQDKFAGWGYRKPSDDQVRAVADNSNTQYALLGLLAGKQAGAKVPREVWTQIQSFYVRTQQDDGKWSYVDGNPKLNMHTMTAAGVAGLLISSLEDDSRREVLKADGTATGCGVYEETSAITRGLNWLSGQGAGGLQFSVPGRYYYNIYGIERVGRLSGLRFLGNHDWYREGCKFLLESPEAKQKADGSWVGSTFDACPTISTSFALLFLSKGRTPVLISKLVHTAKIPRPDNDTDWNNDRNDLAHLVDFSSKSLFKNLPLAWQNFDMMRAASNKGGLNLLTEADMLDVTSDLLQSPILYFNGHKSPRFRFTVVEKELLKKYVDNGGFIFAEACCGSQEFDEGFKALANDLWPDNPLEPLDGSHPIWTSFFPTKPGQPYKLMGISSGCKTVLVYSPQDLSCQWESNNFKTGQGEMAFRLGANIVAYATGMEPPRPRLSHVELASTKDEGSKIPRGFFKVAQLKHGGDWHPAPNAMRNLMDTLRKTPFGLDVALKTDVKEIGAKSVIDYKFLYMHGRGEFVVPAEQVKPLRFNLETGGLLFADACCGKAAFDTSFRQFIKTVLPDHKLQEVPLNDPLFGKELNGEILDERTIKCRREKGSEPRPMPPQLEGIKIDNRWVVLYSKYDIGCALERHQSSDCLGYDEKSAKKIAGAAVLYLLELRP